jgi:hypothetical protein
MRAGLDDDQVLILLFWASVGLASITSHCLIRKPFIAALAASSVTALCMSVFVAGQTIFSYAPVVSLQWAYLVALASFVCALPVSMTAGLPFLLFRRRPPVVSSDERRRLWQTPDARRLALSFVLCGMSVWGIVSLYLQMIRNQKDEAVYSAARNGTPADIQRALNIGGNPNSQLGYGTTPLMIASFYGRAQNVEFLLKRGANPNLKAKRGETALQWARENKHLDVVRLLQRAGARE